MDELKKIELWFDAALGQAMVQTLLTGEHEYLSFNEIFLSMNHCLKNGIPREALADLVKAGLEAGILKQWTDGEKELYALRKYFALWRVENTNLCCYPPPSSINLSAFISCLFPPSFNISQLMYSPYNKTNFWLFQAVRLYKIRYGDSNKFDMDRLLSDLAQWAMTDSDTVESGIAETAFICWMEYVWKLYQRWNAGIYGLSQGSFCMSALPAH